jgi:hypothetical protein
MGAQKISLDKKIRRPPIANLKHNDLFRYKAPLFIDTFHIVNVLQKIGRNIKDDVKLLA